ncbi:hypothetical protein M406DRAFT_265358, partial [Cryphonectria parasitica EP155]
FLIIKKNNSLCLINNAQKYNKHSLKNTFMLLALDKFSEKFAIYKILLLLNFFSGYNQVQLYPNSRNIIIFLMLLSLFRMYTLFQSATNSVAQFIRIIIRFLYNLILYIY